MTNYLKFFVCLAFVTFSGLSAFAQDAQQREKLEQALKLKPYQADVQIDVPTAEETAQCRIELTDDKRGFIITNQQGNRLRVFSDANGDNRVDLWCYYQNGIEVYREIDSTGSGKQDQFRWLNSAGTRWGVDTNGDRVIDYWKEISAEEISREIVLALATNDVDRFLRVALTEDELKSLALGEEQNAAVARKIAALKSGFAEAVRAVGFQNEQVQWYQLNAVLPGCVPSGDNGNRKDLVVFENAMTTVGDGNETKQVALGTLVRVADNSWRTIDLPKLYDESQLSYTFIRPAGSQPGGSEANTEIVTLVNQYQEILAEIPSLPVSQRAAKHKEVFACMIRLVAISPTQEERENWVRTLAESIMIATLQDEFPEGSEHIRAVYGSVEKTGNPELAANVRYCQLMTDYYTDRHAGTDDMKAYMKWIENLEQMADEFEGTEEAQRVMMQLASFQEMNSRSPEEPLKWYNKVVQSGGDTLYVKRARGAVMRLNSTGKEVPFKATDAAGKAFDIASLKGRIVLLCFWDSKSTADLPAIKEVVDKFASAGVVAVGVNLDPDAARMRAALAQTPLPWTQLVAAEGINGVMALYWGIQEQNMPCMVLYGKDGKVVRPNIENANELQALLTQLAK